MSHEHDPTQLGTPVLRRKQVCDLLGISHTTLYDWIRAGRFPPAIELGPNSKAWLRDEVEEFLAQRKAARDGQQLELALEGK